MGKTTKIIIAIVIALLAVVGCGYGYHAYKIHAANEELKDTKSITDEKGGQDVTWDTIKTAAKSNDVLVVFVDSKTPYFEPVMQTVKAELDKNTKNNPKVLVVDQQQPSYLKLRGELDSTNGLADDADKPYAIAYKKNQDLNKNRNEMANIHHKFLVEGSNLNILTTPTNIADDNENDGTTPANPKDVVVYKNTIRAFFEGTWVTNKDDTDNAEYLV